MSVPSSPPVSFWGTTGLSIFETIYVWSIKICEACLTASIGLQVPSVQSWKTNFSKLVACPTRLGSIE